MQFLRSWRGTAPGIAGRYEELMIELYERGYVQIQVRAQSEMHKQMQPPHSAFEELGRCWSQLGAVTASYTHCAVKSSPQPYCVSWL